VAVEVLHAARAAWAGIGEHARRVMNAFIGKKDAAAILIAASLFVFTLFFFTPVRIYMGNFMEFSYALRQSALFFLALSAFLAAGLAAVVCASARRPGTRRLIVSVLLASAFLLWLQGNIILWQYGALNGKEIEWRKLVHFGIIDSAVWIGFLAFSVWKAGLVFRFARRLCLILAVIQLLSVLQAWVAMPKDQEFRQQQASDGKTLFRFSKHVNVVILVLDTFQSDIFQDIIRDDPDLAASFTGFTYFRNALAGSDGTMVSIPNMLTASNYDNSVPYLEFVKKSFLANSLPKTLKEYGFLLDLYPIYDYSVYTNFSGVSSSRKKLMDWGVFLKEQAFLTDLAVFRSVPHFLKRAVYNRGRWLISALFTRLPAPEAGGNAGKKGKQLSAAPYNLKYAKELASARKLIGMNRDARFISTFISSADALGDGDAFKFYHLNGIHLQLVMDENCRYAPLSPNRAGMKRQGTGILKIAAMFLEKLRQMQVYDDSLIFIVGDHGAGLKDTGINASPDGARLNARGPYKGLFPNFKSAGIPLVLVKRIGSTGSLRTSDAPVCLGDIPQTVASELKLDAAFPGKSMFRVRTGDERERIYRAFVGDQENVRYLAPLYEYSVKGSSWDDASWKETGKIYYAGEK
jgi:hypothetical protein